jgi:hypothetical protein
MRAACQKGQSMIEYIACLTLAVLTLFIPLGGQPSVAVQLARAVANFFRGFSFLVSIS